MSTGSSGVLPRFLPFVCLALAIGYAAASEPPPWFLDWLEKDGGHRPSADEVTVRAIQAFVAFLGLTAVALFLRPLTKIGGFGFSAEAEPRPTPVDLAGKLADVRDIEANVYMKLGEINKVAGDAVTHCLGLEQRVEVLERRSLVPQDAQEEAGTKRRNRP